jgi:hypothetical protein
MCRAGDTYVGWYPLAPAEWMQLKEDEDNWRLRSCHLQNGEVVEVRSRKEAGPFSSFCAKLESSVPAASLSDGVISVRYRTMAGDVMKATFGRPNELNGRVLRHGREKLFDSPFLSAEAGSQRLTMTYKNMKRVLDFKTLTVTE